MNNYLSDFHVARPDEDFDGLVTSLEDFAAGGF